MMSLAMGAAMMGTMYFLWARCAQHGGSASGWGLVCVSLRSYRDLRRKGDGQKVVFSVTLFLLDPCWDVTYKPLSIGKCPRP